MVATRAQRCLYSQAHAVNSSPCICAQLAMIRRCSHALWGGVRSWRRVRRSRRQWHAMVLVPTVAANMVNARLASSICLIALRHALRGNRLARARGPRIRATLQTLAWSMSCRFCKRQCARKDSERFHANVNDRIRAIAAPRKCVLPRLVHSTNACSHFVWRDTKTAATS